MKITNYALQHYKPKQFVFISSVLGYMSIGSYADYCASKFGIRGFAEGLRLELTRPTDPKISIVCPSSCNTRFLQYDHTKTFIEKISLIQPTDVTNAIRKLLYYPDLETIVVGWLAVVMAKIIPALEPRVNVNVAQMLGIAMSAENLKQK